MRGFLRETQRIRGRGRSQTESSNLKSLTLPGPQESLLAMTQHEIKAEPSGKAPSVQPTCAGLGLAGRARAPLPLLGGVRLGMRRARSPPASPRPRSVPKAHPPRPGAYPGPSGARRSSRCCASSRYRRSWACWRRRLRGRRREGGGRTRSCTARLRSVPSARPESPRKRPPRGALQPRPRPRLPGPCPAGAQPLSPYCALAIRVSRVQTRHPLSSSGGWRCFCHPQATLLKVDGGRGLAETRLALRGNCGSWAVGIWRSFIPFSALL